MTKQDPHRPHKAPRTVRAFSGTLEDRLPEGLLTKVSSPPKWLLVAEARAAAELAAFYAFLPFLNQAPKGDGHGVVVLPGFFAGDLSTKPMRDYFESLGYQVFGWNMGQNLGPTHTTLKAMDSIVQHAHRRTKGKVSIVGWSLGGIYAREMSRRHTHMVRRVITMGSPIRGNFADTNLTNVFEVMSPFFSQHIDEMRNAMHAPPPVPASAIYTKSDGVVPWRACLELPSDHTENIQVIGSHCGLGFNPAALWAVADRLALPEGHWRRYDRLPPLIRLAQIMSGKIKDAESSMPMIKASQNHNSLSA